jgi:hypothetical protein
MCQIEIFYYQPEIFYYQVKIFYYQVDCQAEIFYS